MNCFTLNFLKPKNWNCEVPSCYSINRSLATGCEYFSKAVLEIAGFAGAIWGCTEVVLLRNGSDPMNNNIVRVTAIVVGLGIGSVRFAYKNIPPLTRWADRALFGINPASEASIEA